MPEAHIWSAAPPASHADAPPPMSPEAPLWQAVVCGWAGGTGAALVGHPLETMKARVQMGLPSWPGLRGLYVGLAAPILGNAPFWACYFASYRAAQRHVAPYFGDDTAAAQLAVGAVAGAASAVALTPIDAVKVTAQVDQVSTAAAFRRLRERRELFRALLPTVVRMIPSTAVRSFCVDICFRAKSIGRRSSSTRTTRRRGAGGRRSSRAASRASPSGP